MASTWPAGVHSRFPAAPGLGPAGCISRSSLSGESGGCRSGRMRKKSWRGWLILFVFLIVPGLARSQAAQQSRTLIVNGQSGQVKVVRIDGRSYVDLESLARIANGTLGFSGDQITLTLPGPAAGTPSAATPSGPPANPGFSKEFLRAGIEEMAVIREWRTAMVNSIQNNYPISEDWVANFRGQASISLKLAAVAASTDPAENDTQQRGGAGAAPHELTRLSRNCTL